MTTTDPTVPATAPQPATPGAAINVDTGEVTPAGQPLPDADTSPMDLGAAAAHIEKAHQHVVELCSGQLRRWRMSIPAQPDRDDDLVISQALIDAEALVAEVRRLRGLADHQEHHLGASHSNPADELDAAPAAPNLGRIRSLAENLQRCAADSPFFVGFGEAILEALGDAAPVADECPACGRLHFPWCHPHGAARATEPTTYALPAEPDGPLWYPDGTQFDRLPPPPELRYSDGARFADHWGRAGFAWQGGVTWQQLLCVATGPLSTVPPAGTEGES